MPQTYVQSRGVNELENYLKLKKCTIAVYGDEADSALCEKSLWHETANWCNHFLLAFLINFRCYKLVADEGLTEAIPVAKVTCEFTECNAAPGQRRVVGSKFK